VYAQWSLESSLVSLRQLLAMPDPPDEIRDELMTLLNSFWVRGLQQATLAGRPTIRRFRFHVQLEPQHAIGRCGIRSGRCSSAYYSPHRESHVRARKRIRDRGSAGH
jgi:hypothetical protein